MAAESGKIDPMHQFEVTPLGGGFNLGGHEVFFTNSALWMVIAAVVLGGTSLMGGRGTILGTVLGTLTIAVIGNGLILMHISPFFTQIVTGAIILIAIWLNTRIFTAKFRLPGKRGGAK